MIGRNRFQLVVCLLAVATFVTIDQIVCSAPALPPICDKWCSQREGPFIGNQNGSPDDTICFRYSVPTCISCNGTESAYRCEATDALTNRICIVELIAEAPGTIKIKKRYYLPTEGDECSPYCQVTNPGYQARVRSGVIDPDLDVEMDKEICDLPVDGDPPPPPPA